MDTVSQKICLMGTVSQKICLMGTLILYMCIIFIGTNKIPHLGVFTKLQKLLVKWHNYTVLQVTVHRTAPHGVVQFVVL